MPTGERITTTPRYIKHPPAASFEWVDGHSVDAGTAHIVHSNLSHLSAVNLKFLGCVMGPGAFQGWDASQNGYKTRGIIDATPPADPADVAQDYARIAWLVAPDGDAVVIGPVSGVPLTLSADPPGFTPRRIRVMGAAARGTSGTGGVYFVAAVTKGPAPPSVQTPLAYVVSSFYTAAGAIDLDITLEVPTPVPMDRDMVSRASAADAESTTRVMDLYVWLGWYSASATSDVTLADSLYHVEAWEIV
jgi:hypothetical protein